MPKLRTKKLLSPPSKPVQKIKSACDRVSHFIERCSAWCAGTLLLINILDVLYGIIVRYVFNSSVIWTEEVARYSLIWLVMFGTAGALANGEQMSIDFLLEKFPNRLKTFAWIFRFAVQVFILVLLIWFGVQNVMGTWNMRTMALGIPKAVPLLAVPIGMSMLLILLIARGGK